MIIRGNEYGFSMTVGASVQIAKICPNNDIKKLAALLRENKDDYIKTIEIMTVIMKAMNGGYVAGEELKGKKANRLTDDIIFSLTTDEFQSVQKETLSIFKGEGSGEVDAEPVPTKGKKDNTEAKE